VPLMVSRPGAIPPGTRTSAVVHAVDLYPTVLELTGAKPNAAQILDGVSFANVLRDPQAKLPRDAVFNYFPQGTANKPGGVWVRQGEWKLIRWFETGPEYPNAHELYNLRDDLSESKNLANDLPEKVRALDALIDRFLKDTNALVPKPNPDYQASSPPSPTVQKTAGPVAGWSPRFCRVEVKDGTLVVTGEGKTPFLAATGLKHAGPITLRLRVRAAGGAGKAQWRTSDQEQFPPRGQTVDFTLPASADWSEVAVELPVNGVMQHLRLYLPAQQQAVTLDGIELKPSNGKSQRWEF